MTNSNSSSLSRAWLRANCCRCGDTRQDTMNNNLKEETPLREETETLLHRIAFTVWHTALHIESEVRGCCLSSAWFFPHFSLVWTGERKQREKRTNEMKCEKELRAVEYGVCNLGNLIDAVARVAAKLEIYFHRPFEICANRSKRESMLFIIRRVPRVGPNLRNSCFQPEQWK